MQRANVETLQATLKKRASKKQRFKPSWTKEKGRALLGQIKRYRRPLRHLRWTNRKFLARISVRYALEPSIVWSTRRATFERTRVKSHMHARIQAVINASAEVTS